MAYVDFLAIVSIFCTCIIFSAQSRNQTHQHTQNGLDTLLDDVISEVPRKDASMLFSQLFKNENKVLKSKKKHFTISPRKDELGTKKSIQAMPKPDVNPAITVALSKPNVYFVDLGLKAQLEKSKMQEYDTAKRFRIPQEKRPKYNKKLSAHIRNWSKPDTLVKYDSIIYIQPKDRIVRTNTPDRITTSVTDPKRTIVEESHEYRTKRQEGLLDERLSILPSTPDTTNGIQTVPVQTLSTIIPAQSSIGDVGIPSDVTGINSNKMVAMVPVKMDTSLASPSSVALVSQTPQIVQPEVLGTSRSTLPVTTLIHTSPDITTTTLRSPDDENLLVRLGDQQNRFANSDNQDSRLKLTPENENEVIKLAQVPLSLLNPKTEHPNDVNATISNEQLSANKDSKAIKLDSIKSLTLESNDSEKVKSTTKEKLKEDINRETLKKLQSRLTNIISKLEGKMSKNQGRLQPKKEESLRKIAKNKPSEKSLIFLKKRLSHVLKKFNSKPGRGQPFTIGQEWRSVLSDNVPSRESDTKKEELKKTKNATEDEGNWPSIASQLLRKLNGALMKLQEKRVAHSLGKNAVMFFSFEDKPKSARYNDNPVEDKSGHFNDASVSGRAHTSSRTYSSCGKALILDSGNLHFTPKYFKTKPTKAITLAMWVRTNVTGYVKWFVRGSGSSREFNTHTQYPLVNKNVWTHLCGTFNSSTGITRIYVDGELKTEKVNRRQDSIPADFTPAGIGPEFGDENLIAVDEVYMFARALNPREVRTLYDECEFNRMVLHYGFNKINSSAALVFDQSGSHNDGQLQGDARVLDSGCDKCGSCLDLNAKGNPRLAIQATRFKHKPTKAISIGAWFNLNSTTGTHALFSVTESILNSPILNLLVTDGKLRWEGYNKDHNEIFNLVTSQAVVPEGIWVHILATFDSLHGQAKIFINGYQKALAKTTKKVPIAEDWSEIKIGGHDSSAQTSGGYMDEIVLYNWELETSEITYIMKYCPDHPKLVSFTVHVPLD